MAGSEYMVKSEPKQATETFARNLRQYRKEKYKTQKEFAEKLGIETGSYTMYENGLREPKFYLLNKIAEALGVSMGELIGSGEKERTLQLYWNSYLRQIKNTLSEEEYERAQNAPVTDLYPIWDEAEQVRRDYIKKRIEETWLTNNMNKQIKQAEKMQRGILPVIAKAIGVQYELFEQYWYTAVASTPLDTPLELLFFTYFTGFDSYRDTYRHRYLYVDELNCDEYVDLLDTRMEGALSLAGEKPTSKSKEGYMLIDKIVCRDSMHDFFYQTVRHVRPTNNRFKMKFYTRCMEYERSEDERILWIEEMVTEFLEITDIQPETMAFGKLKELFFTHYQKG